MNKGFIILFFLLFSCNAMADVYFTIPYEMELEEMNKGMKKTKNRYSSEKQIENQYKGKLKYKPSDSLYKNDRNGRYFTSVYFLVNDNGFITANDKVNGVANTFWKKGGVQNSFSAEIGRYFSNSIFLSFEYFEYAVGNAAFDYMDGNYNDTLEFEHNGQVYVFNFGIENNYSRLIPFFGAGIGAFRSTFHEMNTSTIVGLIYNTEISDNLVPMYQFFAGFDFLISDDMYITAKYKYFALTKDIRLKRVWGSSTYRYDLELEKNNSSFMIGFKYIW